MKIHSILAVLVSITLTTSVMAQDEYRPSAGLFGTGDYSGATQVRPLKTFTGIADAMNALPAMPTAACICSGHAKYVADSTVYAPYNLAIVQTMVAMQNEPTNIMARINQSRQKQAQRAQATMQHYNRNVEAGLMPSQEEMMQIILSSGINLEKADEKQMMEVVADACSKKWGVSKDEYLKIITLAQKSPEQAKAYMQSAHPDLYKRLYAVNAGVEIDEAAADSRDEQFTKIHDELGAVQEEWAVLANAYDAETYEALAEELQQDWLNSQEAKQIDAIEEALWKRVEQWQSGIGLNSSGMADVPYPGWWTDERKKENALIDSWNNRAAQKWLAKTGEKQKKFKAVFDKLAALENENEQLAKQGDAENMIYLMNKQQLLTFLFQLQNLYSPYVESLRFPCIEHVDETGTVHMGKG